VKQKDVPQTELKGLRNMLLNVQFKVAVSEDVQNCADEGIQIYGGMGFSEDTPMESAWRDAELLVFMKVQTKSTECYL
jgi:alkylation response protein AidB-like acyl-CoA dehydrogenase